MLSQRWTFALVAIGCAALMGTALFFQHVKGLEPCPLCIFQRVFVIGIGVIALVAAVHDPKRVARRVYGILVILVSALGIGVSARHVWLQSLPPDQVPECGPGLGYMLDAFPIFEALEMVFRGSGECAEVQWLFLGISMPGWMLFIFTCFAFGGLYVAFTRPPGHAA
jgi:disulfide bond formation protein DsbB